VTAVDELLAFVRSQLDAKEREAREFLAQPGRDLLAARLYQEQLAEVEAKRRILDDWQILRSAIRRVDDVEGNRLLYARLEARESDIRWLAQAYARQPGWREEWRS
jgi:hypothetical protein